MAKRLLLFGVCFIISISFSWGQCAQKLTLYLNNYTVSYEGQLVINDPATVCKGNKNVFNFYNTEGGI